MAVFPYILPTGNCQPIRQPIRQSIRQTYRQPNRQSIRHRAHIPRAIIPSGQSISSQEVSLSTQNTSFSPLTQELRDRLLPVVDIEGVIELLHWDMSTYMPPGGAQGRSRQIGMLERMVHQQMVDPALGHALDRAENAFVAEHGADPQSVADSDDAALLRIARRNYERLLRVPVEFTAETEDHLARTYSVWTTARAQNDFALVRPYLEKTLAYSRQYAQFFEGFEHPIDVFIDNSDYGLTAAIIRPLFKELGEFLSPFLKQIDAQPKPRHDFLHRHYPKSEQLAYGEQIARRLGYDFERGRQDTTYHPFMTKFAQGDVRITTRVNENDVGDNLFSIMHEVGHALYEQGIDPRYDGTPLLDGTSNGIHESQSRLWENLVGRSKGFWEHNFAGLQATFPQQLNDVTLDEFYRAINLVRPSLIRTDADEVSYNLHVVIRFELECRLLEGTLDIEELPQAWHEAYEATLGVRAPNDADGVLQDVHWFAGFIGGSFQGYALGNIISSQIYEAALEENPNIPTHIRRGEQKPLLRWLQDNVYRFGSKYTTRQLLERLTGSGITLDPYIRYLQQKYGDLYNL